MHENALATAQAEAAADPKDAFAWFNVGTNLTALGRHDEAAAAYDQARLAGLPWRMLWYQFGPYRAYYETGRYEDVRALPPDRSISRTGRPAARCTSRSGRRVVTGRPSATRWSRRLGHRVRIDRHNLKRGTRTLGRASRYRADRRATSILAVGKRSQP